jgi:hypothetical protein
MKAELCHSINSIDLTLNPPYTKKQRTFIAVKL